MNAIVPSQPLVPLRAPRLSHALADAVAARLSPHPDVAPAPASAALLPEVRAALPAFEALARPATVEDWARWLSPLRAVLGNAPPDRAALVGSAQAMAAAMHEVPLSALTEAVRAEALRKLKWWPTPADLWPMFAGAGREARATANALRNIIAEAQRARPEAPAQIGQAEREAIAAAFTGKAKAAIAEGAADRDALLPPARRNTHATASHLTPQQLRQAYAAIAREHGDNPHGRAARTRLQQLPEIEG